MAGAQTAGPWCGGEGEADVVRVGERLLLRVEIERFRGVGRVVEMLWRWMMLEEEREAWGEQFEEEEKMANFAGWK
ncbi:hypothetical protein EYF80_014273 [Liparis tanakae]|uniref:Uncharacterized protein n=1 Tax=Liparis tanakae TaxID=230148 RepID=A0A4Z2ICM0_9TELE|nr:hypothetical protein EYF80_014273 [Liparis tanakae]